MKREKYILYKKRDIKALVFSGGGAKGVTLIGAVEALEDAGILDGVEKTAGSSIGALTACLLAFGVTSKDISAKLKDKDFKKLLGKSYKLVHKDAKEYEKIIEDLILDSVKKYFDNNPIFLDFETKEALENHLKKEEEKGKPAPEKTEIISTIKKDNSKKLNAFKEDEIDALFGLIQHLKSGSNPSSKETSFILTGKHLRALNKLDNKKFKKLFVGVANINKDTDPKKRFELIDTTEEKYGDKSISELVRISGSLPILVKPGKIGNDRYIDGGYLNNVPLDALIDHQKSKSEQKQEKLYPSNALAFIFDEIPEESKIDKQSPIISDNKFKEKKYFKFSAISRFVRNYLPPFLYGFKVEKRHLETKESTFRYLNKKNPQGIIAIIAKISGESLKPEEIKTTHFKKAKKHFNSLKNLGYQITKKFLDSQQISSSRNKENNPRLEYEIFDDKGTCCIVFHEEYETIDSNSPDYQNTKKLYEKHKGEIEEFVVSVNDQLRHFVKNSDKNTLLSPANLELEQSEQKIKNFFSELNKLSKILAEKTKEGISKKSALNYIIRKIKGDKELLRNLIKNEEKKIKESEGEENKVTSPTNEDTLENRIYLEMCEKHFYKAQKELIHYINTLKSKHRNASPFLEMIRKKIINAKDINGLRMITKEGPLNQFEEKQKGTQALQKIIQKVKLEIKIKIEHISPIKENNDPKKERGKESPRFEIEPIVNPQRLEDKKSKILIEFYKIKTYFQNTPATNLYYRNIKYLIENLALTERKILDAETSETILTALLDCKDRFKAEGIKKIFDNLIKETKPESEKKESSTIISEIKTSSSQNNTNLKETFLGLKNYYLKNNINDTLLTKEEKSEKIRNIKFFTANIIKKMVLRERLAQTKNKSKAENGLQAEMSIILELKEKIKKETNFTPQEKEILNQEIKSFTFHKIKEKYVHSLKLISAYLENSILKKELDCFILKINSSKSFGDLNKNFLKAFQFTKLCKSDTFMKNIFKIKNKIIADIKGYGFENEANSFFKNELEFLGQHLKEKNEAIDSDNLKTKAATPTSKKESHKSSTDTLDHKETQKIKLHPPRIKLEAISPSEKKYNLKTESFNSYLLKIKSYLKFSWAKEGFSIDMLTQIIKNIESNKANSTNTSIEFTLFKTNLSKNSVDGHLYKSVISIIKEKARASIKSKKHSDNFSQADMEKLLYILLTETGQYLAPTSQKEINNLINKSNIKTEDIQDFSVTILRKKRNNNTQYSDFQKNLYDKKNDEEERPLIPECR